MLFGKPVVKSVIVVVLMATISWNIWEMTKKGFSFFPLTKMFSLELFLNHRLDPAKMIDNVTKKIIDDFQQTWVTERVQVILESEQDGEIWASDSTIAYLKFLDETFKKYGEKEKEDDGFPRIDLRELVSVNEQIKKRLGDQNIPLIKFLYKTVLLGDKCSVKKFSYFQMSSRLVALIQKIQEGVSEEQIKTGNNNFLRDIKSANNFSPKQYEKLRAEFPGLKYTLEEIAVLRASGTALNMLHTLAHVKGEKYNCFYHGLKDSMDEHRLSSDRFTNGSLRIYSDYFCKQYWQLCLTEAVKRKGKLLLLVASFFFLSLHLIRPGLLSILGQETQIRRLKMPWQYRLRRLLDFWYVVIFTGQRSNLVRVSQQICDEFKQYQEESEKQWLSLQASDIQKKLAEKIGTAELAQDPCLQTWLAVASGLWKKGNQSLAYRRSALAQLQASLDKLNQVDLAEPAVQNKQRPLQKIAVPKTRKEKRTQSKNERMLIEVRGLLPKTASIELESWDNGKLENLRQTLILLRTRDSYYVALLLSKPQFSFWIHNRQSEFMSAVRYDRIDEVLRILEDGDGNGSSQEQVAKEQELEELSLPTDLQIIVLARGRIFGKSGELKKVLGALGPGKERVEVVDATKRELVESIYKGNPENKFLVLTGTSHGVRYKQDKHGEFDWVWVDHNTNLKDFSHAVAVEYWRNQQRKLRKAL